MVVRHNRKMIAFLRGGEPGIQGILKGHKKVCYQNKNCTSRIARTLIIFTYVSKNRKIL